MNAEKGPQNKCKIQNPNEMLDVLLKLKFQGDVIIMLTVKIVLFFVT